MQIKTIEDALQAHLKSQGFGSMSLEEEVNLRKAFAAGASLVCQVYASSNADELGQNMRQIAFQLNKINLHD